MGRGFRSLVEGMRVTVKDLKEALQGIPDNLEVSLSVDDRLMVYPDSPNYPAHSNISAFLSILDEKVRWDWTVGAGAPVTREEWFSLLERLGKGA